MREIKFRAWFELSNRMVEHEDLTMNYEYGEGFTFAFDRNNLLDDGNIQGTLNFKLMQFTGLEDKTGVEIYEGDILRTHKGDFVVTWDKYKFVLPQYYCGSNDTPHDYFSEQGLDEVIGNVYEHPHLLKEASQ